MTSREMAGDRSGEDAVLTGLLQRCAEADETALGELYDRTSSRIYSLILGRVDSEPNAGDILTRVYLHVWRQAAHYEHSRCPPLLWIATIANRTARP